MKKQIIVVAIVVLAGLTLTYTACTRKSKAENVDLVNGVKPVHQLNEDQYVTLDALANLKPEEIPAFLQKHWPNLKTDVEHWVRGSYLKESDKVDSIQFIYGSGKNAKALDSARKTHSGFFKNQLIAKVFIHGPPAKFFFVRCSNGMSFPVDQSDCKPVVINDRIIRITMRNECLMDHLDFSTSLQLGEKLKLPVYLNRNGRKTRTTYKIARKMEKKTDSVRVVIPVYIGDAFDVVSMKYVSHH